MITLVIATIAILLYIAVAVYTFHTEHEQPVDPRIADSFWWYLPM